MTIKLHRCGNQWVKLEGHPCWKVEKALIDQGVPYEVVPEPWLARKKRTAVKEGTGSAALPAIELEDGTWYRKESKEMAREIREGKFDRG
jgi:hypothetical protein